VEGIAYLNGAYDQLNLVLAAYRSRVDGNFGGVGVLHSGVCTSLTFASVVVCGGTPSVAASCPSMFSGCPDAYTIEIND
jgi:hypothetical protein